MNPMKWHTMSMDPMIFEFGAGVFATSLYLIACSYLDEGERPTLNKVLKAWNGTEDDLVEAVKELNDLGIMQPMNLLDFDKQLFLNRREDWYWCKAKNMKKAI